MKRTLTLLTGVLMVLAIVSGANAQQVVFSDDFSGPEIDGSIWQVATGSWSQSEGLLKGTWPLDNANSVYFYRLSTERIVDPNMLLLLK